MTGATGRTRRILRVLWLTLLLASAGQARAEEGDGASMSDDSTSLSGSLRLDYFSSNRDLDDASGVFGANVELKFKHAFSDADRFEAEARIGRDDLTREGHGHVRWISAYWFSRKGPVDLRVGQQKIRWGKADGINPTDFFTPIDFAVALPLESDRYLSVPAARADVQLSETNTLSLVVEPGFTASRLPWPKSLPVEVIDDRPSGWGRPQVGARLLHAGENLDWSISAFHGFSTLPVLDFIGLAANGRPRYQRYYPKSDGLGVDVARNYGQWGFRAELAYTKYHIDEERQSVADHGFLVAGVDRAFGDVNINLQTLWRYTPDFAETRAVNTPGQAFSAAQNTVVYNQPARLVPGMTARIGAKWLHETLETELLWISFFNPGNSLLRPLLTYGVSDKQKILFGGEYYSGPDQSFFGAFKSNRTVFFEFQQFF